MIQGGIWKHCLFFSIPQLFADVDQVTWKWFTGAIMALKKLDCILKMLPAQNSKPS